MGRKTRAGSNLPRNYLDTLDLARERVKLKDAETLKLLYKSIPDTLSQLIRTAFIAPEGSELCVSDFSAIEARVSAGFPNLFCLIDGYG